MFERNFEDADSLRAFGRMGGHGWGFRAGRGTIEPVILEVLLEKPMHGYEIISTIDERSRGLWRPSPGSVYPVLQLLEDKGLVQSRLQDMKKVYSLTEAGQKEAEKASAQHSGFWKDKAREFRNMRGMRTEMVDVMRLARSILLQKSEEKNAAFKGLLAKLKQDLEKLNKE